MYEPYGPYIKKYLGDNRGNLNTNWTVHGIIILGFNYDIMIMFFKSILNI